MFTISLSTIIIGVTPYYWCDTILFFILVRHPITMRMLNQYLGFRLKMSALVNCIVPCASIKFNILADRWSGMLKPIMTEWSLFQTICNKTFALTRYPNIDLLRHDSTSESDFRCGVDVVRITDSGQ